MRGYPHTPFNNQIYRIVRPTIELCTVKRMGPLVSLLRGRGGGWGFLMKPAEGGDVIRNAPNGVLVIIIKGVIRVNDIYPV